MRALLVSFAAYSLWLHWRPVGLHLARHFLDKDRRGAMQQDPVRRQLEQEPRNRPPTRGRSAPDPQRRLPFEDEADPRDDG